VLGVGGGLYAGVGVAVGVRSRGRPPGLSAHPHYGSLRRVVGLVRDEVAWSRAQLAQRCGGAVGVAGRRLEHGAVLVDILGEESTRTNETRVTKAGPGTAKAARDKIVEGKA
jgi:hypothetical protein